MLEEKKNNYIMSIFKKGIYFGLAVCDVTTGTFLSTKIEQNNNFSSLLDELSKYNPAEIIVNNMLFDCEEEINEIKQRFNVYINSFNDDIFKYNKEELVKTYRLIDDTEKEVANIDENDIRIPAINGLLDYLNKTQKIKLEHINMIRMYSIQKYMLLNLATRRNLELTERMLDKSKKGTLLWVLDKTYTSMGGRLLRKWINEPLLDVVDINKRLNAVEELKDSLIFRGDIVDSLRRIYDIERLVGKIAYGNTNARDVISLKNSLKQLPYLKKLLAESKSELLQNLYNNLDELKDIHDLIEDAIIEDPPISITEGGIIKIGYNSEVDELKNAGMQGKTWLVELEAKEKEETGIKNLKVGFNKVFGYYFEVTKSYLNLVPDRYIRKQTLANCERYITEELNELESKILGAEEKVVDLEYKLFIEIRNTIAKSIERLQKAANIVSTLDVLTSFSIVAEDLNYIKPAVNNDGIIDIKNGRHPVIEKMLPTGEFIDNDTYLDDSSDRMCIITGPNMAGKSTYMRQVALITLMAQIGSFVPAKSATIGVVDKIFTRVGASDDLAMGQSTFMVEMMEVAEILKEATKNSLVVLDEIGRGTSTYDGLSIAWAVVEYITNKEKCGAKTLFATHYHELTRMEHESLQKLCLQINEENGSLVFMRKVIPGVTENSYGIHVAKLAGLPQSVIDRANVILQHIQTVAADKPVMESDIPDISMSQPQITNTPGLFSDEEIIISEILSCDTDNMTPMEALKMLSKWKNELLGK